MVTPTRKLFSLPRQKCNAATVINSNINVLHAGYLIYDPKWSESTVENHGSIGVLYPEIVEGDHYLGLSGFEIHRLALLSLENSLPWGLF